MLIFAAANKRRVTVKRYCILAATTLSLLIQPRCGAQGTAFTYQGVVKDNGALANGNYDFQFIVFNVSQFGFPVGPILTNAGVMVHDGLFTASLDFGAGVFAGSNYWLEISVRTNGNGAFAALLPRQQIRPSPYAIFAENVGSGGLAGGTYGNAVTFSNPANSFTGNGTGVTDVNAARLGGLSSSNFWKLGGNAATNDDFIGTTNAQPFDIRVNNARAMRYRLGTDLTGRYIDAPNMVGGYSNNSAPSTVVGATIAGGGGFNSFGGGDFPNKVTHNFGTVSGGERNTVSGDDATVSGGLGNIASGSYATAGGGLLNTPSGAAATVTGGEDNSAGGNHASVSGGLDNTASGDYSMAAGGQGNTASGDFSFAAGRNARASHNGSFVWADDNLGTFSSTAANQFRARTIGGAAFVTGIDGTGAATSGVRVQSGDTSWSSISDRNAKKNCSPVDYRAVLEKLASLPVQSWNYKWEPDTNTPHLGPMAQDFKAAFYPGRDDKSISTLEFDGVELAAIQGLNEKLERQRTENEALKRELAELKELVMRLAH